MSITYGFRRACVLHYKTNISFAFVSAHVNSRRCISHNFPGFTINGRLSFTETVVISVTLLADSDWRSVRRQKCREKSTNRINGANNPTATDNWSVSYRNKSTIRDCIIHYHNHITYTVDSYYVERRYLELH